MGTVTNVVVSLFTACQNCGHLGWSHDNWSDCAECPCTVWQYDDPVAASDPDETDSGLNDPPELGE